MCRPFAGAASRLTPGRDDDDDGGGGVGAPSAPVRALIVPGQLLAVDAIQPIGRLCATSRNESGIVLASALAELGFFFFTQNGAKNEIDYEPHEAISCELLQLALGVAVAVAVVGRPDELVLLLLLLLCNR